MRLTYSLTILLLSLMLLFSGCSHDDDSKTISTEQNMTMEDNRSLHEYYVCPMHPSEISNYKENCSICGMYLEKKSASLALSKDYICPMHPNVTSDHKENCSICGMYLIKQDKQMNTMIEVNSSKVLTKTDNVSNQKANPYAAYQYKRDKKRFVCPMHPNIKSDHKENCSICGMFLQEKQHKEHNKSLSIVPERKLYKIETTCFAFKEGSREYAKRQNEKYEKEKQKNEQTQAQSKQKQLNVATTKQQHNDKLYYICPMHPSVVSEHKDNCPICGMFLVKQKEQSSSSNGVEILKFSSSVVQKMGVKTTTVLRGSLKKSLKTAGNVVYNRDRVSEVTSKTSGWVENLSLRRSGLHVRRGQLLLELYAPKYLKVQNEFLKAQKIDHSAGHLQKYGQRKETVASRDTLRYLDVPESAINEMVRTGKTRHRIPIYAPQYGEVVQLNIKKHTYVYEDDVMLTIADLSSMWVEVHVFQHQLEWLQRNQTAEIVVDVLAGKTLRGRVDAIAPELDPRTHTVKVRIAVANPDYILRPNMYTQVTIFDNDSDDVLKIPREALIVTGDRSSVIKSLGDGKFTSVDVVAGLYSGGEVEIKSGLKEGDIIVTSGQFLIDSEANLRASFKRLRAKNSNDVK